MFRINRYGMRALASGLALSLVSPLASGQAIWKKVPAPATKDAAQEAPSKDVASEAKDAPPDAAAKDAQPEKAPSKDAPSKVDPAGAASSNDTPGTPANHTAEATATPDASTPQRSDPGTSPFRAVGEKAAALSAAEAKDPRAQRSRRDRSLFEMSHGATSTTPIVDRKEPEKPPATLDDLGNLQNHWQLFAHFRGTWVSDSNLDPFDDDDFMAAAGVGGGRVLYSDGQLSLAALAYIEAGGSESQVRGSTSNFDLARIALGPELRYHVIPRSYLFARVFPALLRAEASVEDPVTASTLEDHQLAFALDLGAGIAFNAAGEAHGEGHKPRLWVIAEGGYGMAFLRDLTLDPEQGDPAPARVESLRWDAPSLNAPLMRLSVALTL